jgi:hypothetical protein
VDVEPAPTTPVAEADPPPGRRRPAPGHQGAIGAVGIHVFAAVDGRAETLHFHAQFVRVFGLVREDESQANAGADQQQQRGKGVAIGAGVDANGQGKGAEQEVIDLVALVIQIDRAEEAEVVGRASWGLTKAASQLRDLSLVQVEDPLAPGADVRAESDVAVVVEAARLEVVDEGASRGPRSGSPRVART